MAFFHARTALYALLALVTITVFTGQHLVPPIDRDESRFAQASRQMLHSGDYVTIRFQDDLRAKKPAGIYWLQSSFVNLFSKKTRNNDKSFSIIKSLNIGLP